MEKRINKIKENPGKAMQALAKWSAIVVGVINTLSFLGIAVDSYLSFGEILIIFIVFVLVTVGSMCLVFIPFYAYGVLIEDVNSIKKELVRDHKVNDDFTLPML